MSNERRSTFNLKTFHENEDIKPEISVKNAPITEISYEKQISIKELTLTQSFLKKEAQVAEKIEIDIKAKIKPSKKTKKDWDGPKVRLPKFLIASIILILIATIWAVIYIFVINKPFYNGKWEGILTDSEKIQGIKTLSYDINPQSMAEQINSEIEGLTVSARLVSKLSLVSENGKILSFKKVGRKIQAIEINVPKSLCDQVNLSCDQLKVNFEKSFRDEIEKQNKATSGTIFQLTKRSDAEIKLESNTESTRILTKTK